MTQGSRHPSQHDTAYTWQGDREGREWKAVPYRKVLRTCCHSGQVRSFGRPTSFFLNAELRKVCTDALYC